METLSFPLCLFTIPTMPQEDYRSGNRPDCSYFASFDCAHKMDHAFAYTTASIDKCRVLADFIKARQAIEAEYAASLRTAPARRQLSPCMSLGKLCKTVSLQPLEKKAGQGGRWFRRGSTSGQPGEDEEAMLMKSTLWSTFYELVDDTSQIAKSHVRTPLP